MIILTIILGLMVVILGYTTFNLLRKLEKQEDAMNTQATILASYLSYLNKISDIIEFSDKKLKEVDHKGSFKSDDEVGFFFEEIKQIQTTLNQFKVKNL
jgi:Tfp pilus assembly protein PilO